MRKMFLLLIPLAVILGCSFSSQRSVFQKENTADTVVCSEKITRELEYRDKEFFVVTKNDTSAYSCLFYPIQNNKVAVKLYFATSEKYHFLFKDELSAEDTTAFEYCTEMPPAKNFRVPSYKELLNEINLCMEAASKVYKQDTMYYLRCYLGDLSDIAVMTTNNLNTHFKPDKKGFYLHDDIKKALKETPLTDDLNKILKNYGLEVEDIYCEGIRFMFEKKVFMESSNISKDLKVPDQIASLDVSIDFISIEENKEKKK